MTGSIVAFAGPKTKIPAGWVACDGQLYNRKDPKYAALFDAIGTAWGNDAADNFAVPDLRGYFLRGVSEGTTFDPERDQRPHSRPDLSDPGNGGNAVGSKQDDAFASHVHVWSSGQGYNAGGGGSIYARNDAGFNIHVNTSSAGGAETRPKNAYVYYIIQL